MQNQFKVGDRVRYTGREPSLVGLSGTVIGIRDLRHTTEPGVYVHLDGRLAPKLLGGDWYYERRFIKEQPRAPRDFRFITKGAICNLSFTSQEDVEAYLMKTGQRNSEHIIVEVTKVREVTVKAVLEDKVPT
jgi:hypothetical protein